MTNPDPPEGTPPYDATLATLSREYPRILDEIRNGENPQRSYELATELAGILRACADEAAALRALMAARIADEEKMTLTKMGELLHVSKQRAGQLVRAGRKVVSSNN